MPGHKQLMASTHESTRCPGMAEYSRRLEWVVVSDTSPYLYSLVPLNGVSQSQSFEDSHCSHGPIRLGTGCSALAQSPADPLPPGLALFDQKDRSRTFDFRIIRA